ncbi:MULTISPECIES: hypothetical protein [Bacillaceae]|uniref:hypothetical protein n=1 Tax=Bacillaceae TaxID=186817 RepID=UPI000382A24B|nr:MULTISPECIES: hypothetical protein [Bacillaceae]
MTYHKMIRSVLGVDVRPRSSNELDNTFTHDPFANPIIHKQINGTEIVPINLRKLWGK